MVKLDERFYQRLEEVVDELKDIANSVSPQYGGNNIREEIKRIADGVTTSGYELQRVADALEIIVTELTK